MKKSFFLVFSVAAFLFCHNAFSQSNNRHNSLGLYIGPNFSNVDIKSPQLTSDTRSGYQAGIFYRSGKLVYGQAGLQYQLMKSNFQIVDSTPDVPGDVSFKRIQVPLYGGLNLVPVINGVLNIRAFAGPVISYDFNILENDPVMSPEDFARFRVDGTFGAGLDVLIFSLDAGYTFGFSNLFSNDLDGKGNYAFVNVGLKF
ncbi:MAG TPA: outer membrane beta-barrel protein [Chitinophagales bacterium]|nr:outer membrane beta-barrel protein [Chitinophagales bacterium]